MTLSTIIFISSGLLILIILIGQYIRLKMSPRLQARANESILQDPVKRFFFGFNRDSITIFFRVIYRLVIMTVFYVIRVIKDTWDSFLSTVQANDVRKEKGAVSFYLKHVSLDKKSRTEN